ncbi:hypothetical protein HK107_09500 [Parvularcula sp. ZS-1/3]|uniref:DUF1579 domain-containing protein n=1 Tax=Parvularcula mediterranea TaxID=2732508 RepID=A0A7Y3W5F2_9PROT|nr:hypothetical protein [Parvularcula mediterranea]NNU16554.1 hypothetical protein [Parvularcula mediterranea]
MISVFAAIFSLAASGEVATAPRLVGDWTCTAKGTSESFVWRVSDDGPDGFLVGEVQDGDRRMALELWAYDEDGLLGTRRQFADGGTSLAMVVTERDGAILRSQGAAALADGNTVSLRHTLTWLGDGELTALWEVADGDGFRTHADEICRRGS